MSHFLTVAFGNNSDRGLTVLKKLNLKLLRKVNIQSVDVSNRLSAVLCPTIPDFIKFRINPRFRELTSSSSSA